MSYVLASCLLSNIVLIIFVLFCGGRGGNSKNQAILYLKIFIVNLDFYCIFSVLFIFIEGD